MSKVRWGLLSTANINRRLIPAIRASRRGELVAVASRDQARAKTYARDWRIPQAFGSYEAMLNSGEIDAVYISLPNHLHAEWSIRAMQAGVHVLCEKPLAVSVAEVDQMIATSKETGRALAEAFMYRHHPQTKLVGEWVHSGRLGEVALVWGAFHFDIGSRQDIRLVPEFGGGCLWDVGVYPLSFAQYIFGESPHWVAGFQWLGDTGVDESFTGQMIYSGNSLAQISASFRTPFYIYFEIIGTQGRLAIRRPFLLMEEASTITYYPQEGEVVQVPVPKANLYLGEVEDMHAAILDDAPPYLTLQESRNHIRTVEALYQSAKTHQLIELNSVS